MSDVRACNMHREHAPQQVTNRTPMGAVSDNANKNNSAPCTHPSMFLIPVYLLVSPVLYGHFGASKAQEMSWMSFGPQVFFCLILLIINSFLGCRTLRRAPGASIITITGHQQGGIGGWQWGAEGKQEAQKMFITSFGSQVFFCHNFFFTNKFFLLLGHQSSGLALGPGTSTITTNRKALGDDNDERKVNMRPKRHEHLLDVRYVFFCHVLIFY